jgi:hypothetical protein
MSKSLCCKRKHINNVYLILYCWEWQP